MIRSSLSLALAVLCGSVAAAETATPSEIVRLSSGDVRGETGAAGSRYLGIPYAAPPVGELRWRPPQEAPPWSQTLSAIRFGNFCPQPLRGVFASPSHTEDCLYLNVFTPPGRKEPSRKRPVMVWFHGGGLFSGESNDYDGSALAARGDVVVVTINYRIGALGFLSHPALNSEGHAAVNYGIMDQQFALKWVQRNIAAFGGDPASVTLFGQSGGGTAVMANLRHPDLDPERAHKTGNRSGTLRL